MYDVVWPRAPRTEPVGELAARPATLDDKTVAFVWDYLFRGDEIFPVIEAELTARYAGVRFVDWSVFGSTHGENEHEIVAGLGAKLRSLGVDAVVSGMAC